MKYILSFCTVAILSINVYGQQVKPEITWDKNYNLQRVDYRGLMPENPRQLVHSAFNVEFDRKAYKEVKNAAIKAVFYTESSWYKPNSGLTEQLLYEQIIFDIYEAGARHFRKSLDLHKGKLKKKDFDAYYVKSFNYIQILRDGMDSATNQGADFEQVIEWQVRMKEIVMKNYNNYCMECK